MLSGRIEFTLLMENRIVSESIILQNVFLPSNSKKKKKKKQCYFHLNAT